MPAIEIKTVIIRGGKDFKKFGDPYEYCLSAFIDGDCAMIYGLVGKFSFKDYTQVKAEFAKIGVFKAKWERHRVGTIKEVNFNKGE